MVTLPAASMLWPPPLSVTVPAPMFSNPIHQPAAGAVLGRFTVCGLAFAKETSFPASLVAMVVGFVASTPTIAFEVTVPLPLGASEPPLPTTSAFVFVPAPTFGKETVLPAGAQFVPLYASTCPLLGAVLATAVPCIRATVVAPSVPVTSPASPPVKLIAVVAVGAFPVMLILAVPALMFAGLRLVRPAPFPANELPGLENVS